MKSSRLATLAAAATLATSASAQIESNGGFETFAGVFGFDGGPNWYRLQQP